RGRGTAPERRAGDGAEPDERERELEVRHPDAVAERAAVGGDEDDPAVAKLADRAPRRPRREQRRAEGLVGAEDGLAGADEQRAPADGVHDVAPRRSEREAEEDARADRNLRGEPGRPGPAGHEDPAAAGDRRA